MVRHLRAFLTDVGLIHGDFFKSWDVTKPLIERKWMGFIVSFTNGYHWCHQWFNHLKWPPIFGAVFGPGLFMVTIFDVLDRHPLTGTCQLTMSVKSHQQTDGHKAP